MQRRVNCLALCIAMLALPLSATAQKPIAYPSKGQSTATQNKDEGECHVWAKNSTGIDPAAVATTQPQMETGPAVGGGERARGALRGAVGGAAIGAIAGDTSEGAGVGAVVGTMAGGRRARQNQEARNQAAQSGQQEAINTYYRAYGACMSGRGYSIS